MPVHRKILAGHEYTGFALNKLRSLAKVAKGQGGYASQKFDMPGEIKILLEVSGEQQFVTIWDGMGLYMDSGIAAPDMRKMLPVPPDWIYSQNFADSQLFYSSALRGYVSQKKALGRVTDAELHGTPSEELKVPLSFKMKCDDKGVPLDGQAELAHSKKAVSVGVPPSMFTGKMRLYFQAQLGAKLENWRFAVVGYDMQAVDYADPDGNGLRIWVGSTGLYTDDKSNYWLVRLTEGFVEVYPLKGSESANALRKALHTGMSQETRDQIEAYILSASYPDVANGIRLPLEIPVFTAMGYGWHFDWGGKNADIVQVDVIEKYPGVPGSPCFFRSTHRHISINRSDLPANPSKTDNESETARWKVSIATVETVDWKSNCFGEPLAFPFWDEFFDLSIWGDKGTDYYFGGKAPVYCFYTRDKLKVVRYSTSGKRVNQASYEFTSSPSYYNGVVPRQTTWAPPRCRNTGNTVGLEPGYSEERSYVATDSFASYYVDDVEAKALVTDYTYVMNSVTKTINGGVWAYQGYAAQGDAFPSSDDSVIAGADGCADTIVSGGVTVVNNHCYVYTHVGGGVANVISASGSHIKNGRILCIIPYGDSEAVYLWEKTYVGDTANGTTNVCFSSNGSNTPYVYSNMAVPGGTFSNGYYTTAVCDGTGYTAPYAHVKENSTIGCHTLVSNRGNTEFKITDSVANMFFAGEELVEGIFWTQTSAINYDTQCVIAELFLTGGYQRDLYLKPWTFMGWA
jgi:hypothetical protein